MSRSLTQRALALGLLALFHVAVFSEVAMLLCGPVGHTSVAIAESHGSGHGHAAPASTSDAPADEAARRSAGDEDGAPAHDQGSCTFCCPNGRSDLGDPPSLTFTVGAPVHHVAPSVFVGSVQGPTRILHTLPNPPPVA